MNRKVQHLLSVGVSALAIGAGVTAAHAATTPGISRDVVGGAVIDDTFVLSDLDTSTTTPADVNVGVTNTGAGSVSAVVQDQPTGGYDVFANGTGTVDLSIVNDANFTIKASATAASAEGEADAYAAIFADGGSDEEVAGLWQFGNGVGAVTLGLDNNAKGVVNLVAEANATGAASGEAVAQAYVATGIYQFAGSEGAEADVALDNEGAINVTATANVAGPTTGMADFAAATAVIGGASATYTIEGVTYTEFSYGRGAIGQQAYGDDASASLTNSGSINLAATANVTGSVDQAQANAAVTGGIQQEVGAFGEADTAEGYVPSASVSLTNAANGKSVLAQMPTRSAQARSQGPISLPVSPKALMLPKVWRLPP